MVVFVLFLEAAAEKKKLYSGCSCIIQVMQLQQCPSHTRQPHVQMCFLLCFCPSTFSSSKHWSVWMFEERLREGLSVVTHSIISRPSLPVLNLEYSGIQKSENLVIENWKHIFRFLKNVFKKLRNSGIVCQFFRLTCYSNWYVGNMPKDEKLLVYNSIWLSLRWQL